MEKPALEFCHSSNLPGSRFDGDGKWQEGRLHRSVEFVIATAVSLYLNLILLFFLSRLLAKSVVT